MNTACVVSSRLLTTLQVTTDGTIQSSSGTQSKAGGSRRRAMAAISRPFSRKTVIA